MLRRGQPTLEADREAFEKNQTVSIQKAINQIESAAKEKHIRNTILGSYQEKGAQTFWHVVRRLPLSSQAIIAWKFCHVLHKLLRDGHPNVLKDSIKYRQQLKDLGKNWGSGITPFGYGRLIGFYLVALNKRMEFHMKYEDFPGNLSINDDDLEKIGRNDVNAFFELSVDILDCIDTLMDLQESIFTSLDMSRAVSLTGPGQCRLSPCILVIQDSSQLYDYAVKLLFKLHACLPADTLSGHRTRFKSCHHKLKKFYYICSNLQYFKRLIQVPTMPDSMPDFLLQSDGSHELGPVRVMPDDHVEPDRSPSPEPAASVGELVNFDEIFGDSPETFKFNGNPEPPVPDHRDQEILQLRAEIERLKAEIELMQTEHSQEVRKLLEKIRDLEQDLRESHMIARDATEDIERLRRQASEAEQQAESAVKAQSLLHGVEKRAIGNEELYRKLKEKHMGLVKDHAELLRKNADTKRQADSFQQSSSRVESESENLREELSALRSELESLKLSLDEKERLKKEERLRLLALAADEACHLVSRATESLDNNDTERTCNAETLMKVVGTAKDSLASLESDAVHFSSTGEIDGLIRSLASFGHWMAEAIVNGGATCNMVQDDQGKVTIMSPTKRRFFLHEQVMALETSCRKCGSETLKLLGDLKQGGDSVDASNTKENLNIMFEMARDLLPRIGEGEDLHDLVEQEMAATSHAVEQAAQRIEALLNEARERDSGVNLEVNERILDSCTELMQMIRILIASSKELQREIVSDGRGASSSKEFYMKNSRWTEGLISAAKAVGWGATMLTDAADLVVQGDGKFEELMVCSHEISASTAQLVAASRVKAGKQSKKLSTLQTASKNVNGATAKVLASTNAGRRQLDDNTDNLKDLQSTVTLTQIKRKEMDSQVKVLELEQALMQERLKLGTLRKKHYELAGVKENEEEDIENEVPQESQLNGNNNNNQSVTKKPNVPQKPHILPKPMTSS